MRKCAECGELFPDTTQRQTRSRGSHFKRCCESCQHKIVTQHVEPLTHVTSSHTGILPPDVSVDQRSQSNEVTSKARRAQQSPRPTRIVKNSKRSHRRKLKRLAAAEREGREKSQIKLANANIATELSSDLDNNQSHRPAKDTRAQKGRALQAAHKLAEITFVDELRDKWPRLLDDLQQRERNNIARSQGRSYPTVTPDVLFPQPVNIFGNSCAWIEYKDSSLAQSKHNNQFRRYVDQFGPGIAVYKSIPAAHLDPIDGVVVKSEEEVLQHVRARTGPILTPQHDGVRRFLWSTPDTVDAWVVAAPLCLSLFLL